MIFQINIVAGGKDEFKSMMLDSIEVNVSGEYSWSFGTPLSKPLYESRGVTVMSQFYLTGVISKLNSSIYVFIIDCLCYKVERMKMEIV